MPGQRQRQLFGITGLLVAYFASHVANAQSDCSDVKVEGGAYSGVYSRREDYLSSDRDVYSTETDDGNFAFLIFGDSNGRRRLEDVRHDLEESSHDTDGAQHNHLSLKEFDFPRAGMEKARVHAGDTLAACSTGYWLNFRHTQDSFDDGLDVILPYYQILGLACHQSPLSNITSVVRPGQVSDCAEHPVDITGTWFRFYCIEDGCASSSDASISISCHDSSDSSLSGGIIAGIMVAVLVIIVAIAGGIICCTRQRQRSTAPPKQFGTQTVPVVYGSQVTTATQQKTSYQPSGPVTATQAQARPPPPPFE